MLSYFCWNLWCCCNVIIACSKNSLDRSSRPDVFCEKGVLRNFAKFTGKYLRRSLFFNKVADSGTGVFLWILRISKNIFFYWTPLVAASVWSVVNVIAFVMAITFHYNYAWLTFCWFKVFKHFLVNLEYHIPFKSQTPVLL